MGVPKEIAAKIWQDLKNDVKRYEEYKQKIKEWRNSPERAERRKQKQRENYLRRKQTDPELHRKLLDERKKIRKERHEQSSEKYKKWREENPELYKLKLDRAKQRRHGKKAAGIVDIKARERARRYYQKKVRKKYGNYDKVVGTRIHENKVDAEVTDEFLKKVWNKGTSNKVIKETKQEISNIIKMYGGMNNVSNYWH